MTLDELRSLLAQLQNDPSAATDEQLSAALDAIREQVAQHRGATPSPETVATLTTLRDLRTAVQAEQNVRVEAAAAAQEAEGLLSELEAEPAQTQAAPAEGDAQAGAEPAADPAGEPAPTDAAAGDASVEIRELAGVTAALGRTAEALTAAVAAMTNGFARAAAPDAGSESQAQPQGRTGRPAPAQTAPAGPGRDTVTARVRAAGGSGAAFQHGQVIESTAELGRAFADRLRGMGRGGGGDGERQYVARVELDYPESRVLRPADFDGNYGKIEAVTTPRALVAAGGLCAPLETLYDVEVVGSTARPLRDALARFQVDRGGIQYRPNSSAAAAVNGAGVWTLENDEAVGVVETPEDVPDPSKGCYVVECPAVEEAVIEAVYLCLEFSNITARFDPETTAANVEEGQIAHARLAENQLYAKIAAGSKVLSAPKVLGAVRDILANLDKAVAYYRNRHRIDTNVPLTYVLPAWVKYLMLADLTRQMAAGDWMDALGVAEAQIGQWFTRRSVTPVWHLDGSTADATVNGVSIARQTYADAAAGAAIPGFPNQIDSLLFTSGSWLFLDGGSLDLGLVRDSVLNARNRYRQFSETFEGVADRGVESLRLVMTVQPTGQTAGTAPTDGITD